MKKLLIRNACLIDKANGYHGDKLYCVAITDDKIEKIAETIDESGYEVIDAQGQYVSAGMIDIHIHHRIGNPGTDMGSADHLGVYRGVTTVIECGSVYVSDADDFAREAAATNTRYFGLLCGLGETPELRAKGHCDDLHIEHYRKAMEDHPGLFVGLKVTASNRRSNDRGYGAVRVCEEMGRELGIPLTVHVGSFPPDPCGIIELMNEGDVVTHTYHGKPNVSLFRADGTPKEGFVRARRRGVKFDVGHGSESFSYPVYDRARRKGFYPDLIGTDIRKENVDGPAYSLAVVMSKIMNLGMSLEDAVEKVTYNAAQTYKLDGLGQIKEGMQADFTFFRVDDVDMEIIDCFYNYQPLRKLIRPSKTICSKHGFAEVYDCSECTV